MYSLIILSLASIGAAWPVQTFKTVPITPPQFVVSKSGASLEAGLILITPQNGTANAAFIMTDEGELVWGTPNGRTVSYSNLNVQTLGSQSVLTYWNGSGSADVANQGHGYGHVSILDTTYKELYNICPDISVVKSAGNFSCPLDIHESYLSEKGTLLATVYNITEADLTSVGGPKNGYAYDSLFYEIDPKTQEILFRWSAIESGIPFNRTHTPVPPNSTSGSTPAAPLDWFHINSVQPVGDGYLINSRSLWTAFLLDSKGEIQWQIKGDSGGDFTFGPGIYYSWEHFARLRNVTDSSAVLSFFNNDNSLPPLNGTNHTTAITVQLDLQAMTATLLDNFADPAQPLYADTQGANSILPNGNSLVGYGQVPVIKEFGPDGDTRMTIEFGDVAQSYRAYRLDWHATPYTVPDVVIEGGQLYVSWNGATDVTKWIVYGGSDKKSLKKIGQVKKTGFESSFLVPSDVDYVPINYVQVGAYSNGSVVRRSAVIPTA